MRATRRAQHQTVVTVCDKRIMIILRLLLFTFFAPFVDVGLSPTAIDCSRCHTTTCASNVRISTLETLLLTIDLLKNRVSAIVSRRRLSYSDGITRNRI